MKNSKGQKGKIQKVLYSTLLEAMRINDFHSLNVSIISENACINRSTFYRYYENKEDLLFRGTNSLTDELCKTLEHSLFSDIPELKVRLESLVNFLEKRKPLLEILFSPKAPCMIREYIQIQIREFLLTRCKDRTDSHSDTNLFHASLSAGMLMSMIDFYILRNDKNGNQDFTDLMASRIDTITDNHSGNPQPLEEARAL